ncbi:MAG: alpha/beta hydrolase [Rhizobiales bacterium]|nr:alpha/beta hydrolase [Hyphomicrobiales bacterium]
MLERAPRTETFTGSANNKLAGDFYGKGERPVLLLHGGGQTRHAFAGTAQELAKAGWSALVLDQRGRGDSDWIEDGRYTAPDFARDAIAVSTELTKRFGRPPVLVGASLGGMGGMLAEGMAFHEKRAPNFAALVLVDVTPRFDAEGASRVRDFMRGKSFEGFATIDEVADAVALYLPHRPRPSSTDGLRKNLRQRDGRWFWHWDPRFFDGPHPVSEERHLYEEERVDAVRNLRIPALLVRGGSSELVKEEHVKEFLALAPQAKFVDVAGARHMVAGDRNDVFSAAIVDFLSQLPE